MPLPTSFYFSENERVQAASEQLAAALFGPRWKEECEPAGAPNGFPSISKDDVMVSYSNFSTTIWVGGLECDAGGFPSQTAFTMEGGISSTCHYRDGVLNDPGDGRPANIEYYGSGKPKLIRHIVNGEMLDSADGDPAEIYYKKDGSIGRGQSSVLGREIDADECRAMVKKAQMRRGLAWAASNLPQDVGAVGMHAPASTNGIIDAPTGRVM